MLNRLGRIRIAIAATIAIVGIVGALVALIISNPPAYSSPATGPLMSPFGLIHGQGSSSLTPRFPIAGGQSAVFYVSGNVSGLYPGSSNNLFLQVQNPFTFNINVTSLTIVPANATTCAATYLTFNGTRYQSSTIITITLNPALFVAAGTTSPAGAVPAEPMGLVMSAPNGCIGAVFSLTYGGNAVQA